VTPSKIDVLGIGNAIVDVIANADDAFIQRMGMIKSNMALIDENTAETIYKEMGSAVQMSGGSAGNTIAGIGSFGGRAGYIGKVKDDVLGNAFRHDIRAQGVIFDTPAAKDGPATARCLILVTPDAERTMNTFLGACVNLTPDDIDEKTVAAAGITYLEGYLFDPPQAKEAFRKAAKIARGAGKKVSLSLSDSFCVNRHRDEFKALINDHIDILFANEEELLALYETKSFDDAVKAVSAMTEVAAITRGAKGSVLIKGSERVEVPATPVQRVVDTTGAGDLYAAGVLYGLSQNLPLAECGRLGSIAAGEIISHFGGRPETPLKLLAGK
jgi:sugar/nucleoside kinase (ribokinase family)